jgi:hypothetical protein
MQESLDFLLLVGHPNIPFSMELLASIIDGNVSIIAMIAAPKSAPSHSDAIPERIILVSATDARSAAVTGNPMKENIRRSSIKSAST